MTTSRIEYLSPLNPVMRTFRIKQENKRYMDVLKMQYWQVEEVKHEFFMLAICSKRNPHKLEGAYGVGCSWL